MKMGRATVAIMAILAPSLIAAGCDSSPTAPAPAPTPPASDGIQLATVSPAPGTSLSSGQTVTFTGTVEYSLSSADSGIIALVIQDQADRGLQSIGTQPRATVTRGSGQVTLSQSITLPDTGITTVRIFFPLTPAGALSTNLVVSVAYPVG